MQPNAKTRGFHHLAMSCAAIFAAVGMATASEPAVQRDDVVIETDTFKFVIGGDAKAKSLVIKATGEECVDPREGIPLFTSTQERPYNNEIKLAYPTKRTTFKANRVRREGDLLIVGFQLAPYEAEVSVKECKGYALFTLKGFRTNTTDEKQYMGMLLDVPPVVSFRLVQLPVKPRKYFGEWMNVCWDDRAAVAVMGADPFSEIDHEERFGFRLLNADLRNDIKLHGGKVAIVAGAGKDQFLSAVEALEDDLDLPRGVKSRRSPLLNASIYWAYDMSPKTVDEHISWAKKGGFRMILLYFSSVCANGGDYSYLGDYDWNKDYPNGEEDLKAVLAKIKAAGITPGFHTLQTHIGIKSRYATPDADPRLNKKQRYTLAKPLPANGDMCDIEVFEDTSHAVKCDKCRVLQFGGELFTYEGFTMTPPYRFTGVKRGHSDTRIRAHQIGEAGGILDLCECLAISCAIDQRTDLQDEVAEKIARIYDCGMEFCYFDGSAGVNPPCGVYVTLSQLRTVKKFKKMPLFTEGSAKSHFGWHLQAGSNAFDVFDPEVFKEKILEYPFAEAPMMQQNFTRLDFGWWGFWVYGSNFRKKPTIGTQPDMWEFGSSKAAAWDCPATIQGDVPRFKKHAHADDVMEAMRRWEDVRARNLLTKEDKERIKDPTKEFHLVPNDKGAYDLVEWEQLSVAGGKSTDVRAFVYERGGRRVVEYWHLYGEATLVLPNGVELAAAGVKSYETDDSRDAVKAAFDAAIIKKR